MIHARLLVHVLRKCLFRVPTAISGEEGRAARARLLVAHAAAVDGGMQLGEGGLRRHGQRARAVCRHRVGIVLHLHIGPKQPHRHGGVLQRVVGVAFGARMLLPQPDMGVVVLPEIGIGSEARIPRAKKRGEIDLHGKVGPFLEPQPLDVLVDVLPNEHSLRRQVVPQHAQRLGQRSALRLQPLGGQAREGCEVRGHGHVWQHQQVEHFLAPVVDQSNGADDPVVVLRAGGDALHVDRKDRRAVGHVNQRGGWTVGRRRRLAAALVGWSVVREAAGVAIAAGAAREEGAQGPAGRNLPADDDHRRRRRGVREAAVCVRARATRKEGAGCRLLGRRRRRAGGGWRGVREAALVAIPASAACEEGAGRRY
mmetsp:Transcript_12324/g.39677  ORF Transcript_12324/g.39677 Transcript_12324/m.39677 type:complete len:368 (-) Transcript_12324:586-1689(-)